MRLKCKVVNTNAITDSAIVCGAVGGNSRTIRQVSGRGVKGSWLAMVWIAACRSHCYCNLFHINDLARYSSSPPPSSLATF